MFSLLFLHLNSSKYQNLVSWFTSFFSLIHKTQKCYLTSNQIRFFESLLQSTNERRGFLKLMLLLWYYSEWACVHTSHSSVRTHWKSVNPPVTGSTEVCFWCRLQLLPLSLSPCCLFSLSHPHLKFIPLLSLD